MKKFKYTVQGFGYKRKLNRRARRYFPRWSNRYNATFNKHEDAFKKVSELKKDSAILQITVYKILLDTRQSSIEGRKVGRLYVRTPRTVVSYDRKEIYLWRRK